MPCVSAPDQNIERRKTKSNNAGFLLVITGFSTANTTPAIRRRSCPIGLQAPLVRSFSPAHKVSADDVETRFQLPEIPLDNVETSFRLPEIPLDNVETRFQLPEMPLDNVEIRFQLPEMPLDNVETRFRLPEIPLDNVETRFRLPEMPLDTSKPIDFHQNN